MQTTARVRIVCHLKRISDNSIRVLKYSKHFAGSYTIDKSNYTESIISIYRIYKNTSAFYLVP